MRNILGSCIAALVTAISCQAETLIIPQSQGWHLSINSNELAVIDTYVQSPGPAPFNTQIVKGGMTNTLELASVGGRSAFAGPLEIIFTSEAAHLITYRKLSGGTAFRTLILRPGETNSISVPAGKTLRFYSILPPWGVDVRMFAE